MLSAWIGAARPKTLPASAAPVLMGAGFAWGTSQGGSLGRTLLALTVALALQVGVNYANDYSDGIRGTDDADKRIGPPRLTGGGLAAPTAVLAAALASFAVAALAGAILVVISGAWWLGGVGVAAIVAAWFYTGGRHPYGYIGGIAEVLVFVFFGLVATLGTTWTQVPSLTWQEGAAASGIGLLSCALLMVNNIRDIPGDREVGKRTLAVRLGDRPARWVTAGYVAVAAVCAAPTSVVVAALTVVAGAWAVRPILGGARGRDLIAALRSIGLVTLLYGAGLGIAAAWT